MSVNQAGHTSISTRSGWREIPHIKTLKWSPNGFHQTKEVPLALQHNASSTLQRRVSVILQLLQQKQEEMFIL
jgi:hypothetical protein